MGAIHDERLIAMSSPEATPSHEIGTAPWPRQRWWRVLAFALIVILAYLTYAPFYPIGLTDHDSMHTEIRLQTEDSYYSWVGDLARRQGRWPVYVSSTLQAIPFLVDAFWYYKLVSFASLLASFGAFVWIAPKLIGMRELTLPLAAVFLIGLQLTTDHSLLTGYFPTYHVFIVALLCSLLGLQKYVQDGKKRWLTISVGLFAICCVIREVAILYLPFHFAIAIAHRKRFLSVLRIMLPFAVATAIYVASYFLYRQVFPSEYAGTTLALGPAAIPDALRALYQLSISAVPPYVVFDEEYRRLFEIYSLAGNSASLRTFVALALERPGWIVRALGAGTLIGLYVSRPSEARSAKRLLALAAVAAVLVFLPNTLLAATPGYQEGVREGTTASIHYTYFSYFGVALLLACTLECLRPLLRERAAAVRGATAVAVGLAIACVSFATSYANAHVARSFAIVHQKWRMMDTLLATDSFRTLPENAVVYAPTLWDVPPYAYYTIQNFSGSHLVPEPGSTQSYWQKYAYAKTGKSVEFWSDRSEFIHALRQNEPIFSLVYRQPLATPAPSVTFGKVRSADEFGLSLTLEAPLVLGPDTSPPRPEIPVFAASADIELESTPALDAYYPWPSENEGFIRGRSAYFYVEVDESGPFEIQLRHQRFKRPEAQLDIRVDAMPGVRWSFSVDDAWTWTASPFVLSLSRGRHLVELRPAPAYRFRMDTARVVPAALKGDLPPRLAISRAVVQQGALEVSGWALAAEAIARIEVWADGERLGKARYGLPRPDVLRGLPDYRNALAGFRFSASGTWETKPETVEVRAYSASELLKKARRPVATPQ